MRPSRVIAGFVATAIATLAALVPLAPAAWAAGGCGITCGNPPSGSTSGQTVTVTVSGSFINGGSPGHGGGSTTVTVSPPCFYISSHQTGKDYYDYVTSGQARRDWFKFGQFDVPYSQWLIPGYLDHQGDTTGSYYGGNCDSGNYNGTISDFMAFATQWFKTHAGTYVPAGANPPIPPVPPELLVQAAQKAMTLPPPLFDHNPKAGAEAFTLVNLPTWFWLTNPTTSGQVTASIPGSQATVTATLASAVFSSPRAGAVSCAGTGVTWSPGATSDCTLSFPHQSTGDTVTAQTSWALHWVYVGQLGNRQGDLAAIGSQDTGTVAVREVQAIDTGVGW